MSATELWGVKDIARALRVTEKAVRLWRERADFPAPLGTPGGRPVWEADEVREWRRREVSRRRAERKF